MLTRDGRAVLRETGAVRERVAASAGQLPGGVGKHEPITQSAEPRNDCLLPPPALNSKQPQYVAD